MQKQEPIMGVVRARVKLTNAIDQALVERGSLAPRHLRACELEGLVDSRLTARLQESTLDSQSPKS